MHYPISLGIDCRPARLVQRNGDRTLSMPLDWVVTPIDSAISLFENKFSDWLEVTNLEFLETDFKKMFDDRDDTIVETRTVITPVIDRKYKILLPHDFSENGIMDLSEYTKRINRMLDLFSDPNHTFSFIAIHDTPNPWQKLQYEKAQLEFVNNNNNWKSRMGAVLETTYSNLQFTLYNMDEYKKR